MFRVNFGLLLFFYFGASCVEAQIEGDAELLRLVALTNRSNLDGLKTWKGRVRINNNFINPDIQNVRNVSFVYDRETQHYLFLAERTNSVKKNWEQVKWGGIRKPEGYFAVSERGNSDIDKNNSKLLVNKKPGSIFGEFSLDFDALLYLRVQNMDVHDRMMNFYKSKENTGPLRIKVSRDKDLVRFVCESGNIKTWYTFDLSQGASPIEWGGSSPKTSGEHKRKFQLVSGIWVPKHASAYQHYPDSGKTMEATVTWEENIVNEPIPASAFQPEKIGVEKGDMVTDRRIDQTYPFEGSVDNESSSWFWPALIITSLVLLAIIAVVFGRRMLYKNALNNS